jgi:hypothetical protein
MPYSASLGASSDCIDRNSANPKLHRLALGTDGALSVLFILVVHGLADFGLRWRDDEGRGRCVI